MAMFDEDDDLHELMFKHLETLKIYSHGLDEFGKRLDKEVREEDEMESHLIGFTQISGTNAVLLNMYSAAETVQKSIEQIMGSS